MNFNFLPFERNFYQRNHEQYRKNPDCRQVGIFICRPVGEGRGIEDYLYRQSYESVGYQCRHGRTESRKSVFDELFFGKFVEKLGDYENYYQRRSHHAKGSADGSEEAAHLRTYESSYVYGKRPGSGFAYRDKIQQRFLRKPTVSNDFGVDERYHCITAADCEKSYFEKSPEKSEIQHYSLYPLAYLTNLTVKLYIIPAAAEISRV